MSEALETARLYDAAFNAQDAETRAANQMPNIEVMLPGGVTLRGPDEVAAAVGGFWEALPDCKITPANVVAAEDTVLTEGILSGTHTGPFRTPQGEIRLAATASNCATRASSRFGTGRSLTKTCTSISLSSFSSWGRFRRPLEESRARTSDYALAHSWRRATVGRGDPARRCRSSRSRTH
jgi:hypothetical protein